jgi:hypothetical protein
VSSTQGMRAVRSPQETTCGRSARRASSSRWLLRRPILPVAQVSVGIRVNGSVRSLRVTPLAIGEAVTITLVPSDVARFRQPDAQSLHQPRPRSVLWSRREILQLRRGAQERPAAALARLACVAAAGRDAITAILIVFAVAFGPRGVRLHPAVGEPSTNRFTSPRATRHWQRATTALRRHIRRSAFLRAKFGEATQARHARDPLHGRTVLRRQSAPT